MFKNFTSFIYRYRLNITMCVIFATPYQEEFPLTSRSLPSLDARSFEGNFSPSPPHSFLISFMSSLEQHLNFPCDVSCDSKKGESGEKRKLKRKKVSFVFALSRVLHVVTSASFRILPSTTENE